MIWEAQCNRVFNNREPDFIKIRQHAVDMVRETSTKIKEATRNLISFSFHSKLSLFTYASLSEQTKYYGLGFVQVNVNKIVILACASNIIVESSTQAEAKAMEEALRCCLDRDLVPHQHYMDSTRLVDVVYKDDQMTQWRIKA